MFDFISDHPQVLILIGGGVIFLFNKYRELKENQQADESIEEIDHREWQTDSQPDYEVHDPELDRRAYLPPPLPYAPPPVRNTPTREKSRSTTPPPLPGISTAAHLSELERQQQLKAKLRQVQENRRGNTRSTTMGRDRKVVTATPIVVSSDSLRSRLRNKSEIRRAMVMREILDPPLGLR